MVASNDRFWAKVLFREYIRHYRKMTDEQIVNDVRQSMDDLEELVEESPTFGSKMVKWSMQRQQEPPAIASRENGKQGGRPRKNSKSTATGNDQVPAGDASHREAEDGESDGNVVAARTTVSGKNYAEEGANGNAALNITPVRKNGALESRNSSATIQGSARPQKTGAGASHAPLLISPLENRAPSPTIANRSDKKQPVNIGAAAPVPPLGSLDCHNREPQAPSPEASHISGDVMSLAYSGEFQNVKLTQEQYSELGIKFGNMQKLNRAIDSLSCKLENEELKPVPKNHYAVLLKWASYREDMEEQKELEESKPKMTNMEKSWIAAMKRVEEM